MEEKDPLSPPALAQEEPPTQTEQHGRKRSAFQYIAVLFAAAFLLLLYTFLMERRQHELLQEENREQISDLRRSVSAVQTLENLYRENEALKEQVDELEAQAAHLDEQLREEMDRALGLVKDVNSLERTLEQTGRAMDFFWQIDEAYVRGRYTLCRDLIGRMEEVSGEEPPLKDYLPETSSTGTDRSSPAQRYQEIFDALN